MLIFLFLNFAPSLIALGLIGEGNLNIFSKSRTDLPWTILWMKTKSFIISRSLGSIYFSWGFLLVQSFQKESAAFVIDLSNESVPG